MTQLVKYIQSDGSTIYIEAAEAGPRVTGFTNASTRGDEVDRVVKTLSGSLASSLAVLGQFARSVHSSFDGVEFKRPTAVNLKLGLSFSAELDAWVIKSSGSGTLEVSVSIPLGEAEDAAG
jgi:hypothetical protein